MTDLGERPEPAAELPPYDPYAGWNAPTAYPAPAAAGPPLSAAGLGPDPDAAGLAAAPVASPAETLATFAQRGRALTIDTALVLIPTAVLLAILLPSVISRAHADPRLTFELSRANLTSGHPESSRIAHWLIVGSIRTTLAWWVSLAVYSGYFMSRTNGQTPGRAAAGIRIVRADLRPIDATWAVYRVVLVRGVLFSIASLLTLGLATLARWGWSLWDDGQRTLDDVLTRSRVVVDPGAAQR